MNREMEMDSFLKYFAKIYIENPRFNVSHNTIYSNLALYGLTQEEISNRSIVQNFDHWVNRFRNDPHLNVYHNLQQPAFLQFHGRTPSNIKSVKLYLSYPRDKIYECVNRIFDFISANKISSLSKVANKLRSDSVVLRIYPLEDAMKVVDFINNDPLLNGTAKSTNPFSMKIGKVGVAYDDRLSYNSLLATILEQYYIECRNSNRLQAVSLKDFELFAITYYRNVFVNKTKFNDFLALPSIAEHLHRFADYDDAIRNYEQVFRLITMSLDGNMNINQFGQFFNSALINDPQHKHEIQQQKRTDIQDDSYARELLHQYIDVAIRKYGPDKVHLYLSSYAEGQMSAITRENNFRNNFATYLPPKLLLKLTSSKISKYVELYIKNKVKDPYDTFVDACLATYEKYGYRQLYTALAAGCKGDYKFFSNGNDYHRMRLQIAISKEDMEKMCYRLIGDNRHLGRDTKDVFDFCCKIINEMAIQKEEKTTLSVASY